MENTSDQSGHAPRTGAVLSEETRATLDRLGLDETRTDAFAAGEPVAFLLSNFAQGTIAVAQFTSGPGQK
jgi:hypothetical protein